MDSQTHFPSSPDSRVTAGQGQRRKSRTGRYLVGIAIIAVLAGGAYLARTRLMVPAAPAAPEITGTQWQEAAIGLATLLPATEIRTLALPSGSTDARIKALAVDTGDKVKAGDILATLDNEGRLKHAVLLAEAAVKVRSSELDLARDRNKASIGEAKAVLAREEAAARVAEQELERTRSLFTRSFVSKALLDQAEATASQARQRVEAATATLSRYITGDLQAVTAVEQGDIRLAQSNLDQAEYQLAASREDLEQAYVRAPINGTVISVHARAGEKPGSDGILDLADTSRMIARAEIYESSIAAVALGAKASLISDVLGPGSEGTVTRIGLQVQRQSIIDKNPAANTDARVVEIDISLDETTAARAARLIGLQVLARIAPAPEAAPKAAPAPDQPAGAK